MVFADREKGDITPCVIGY